MKNLITMIKPAILLLALPLITGCSDKIAVLNPQGPVARSQYHLIIWSLIMMSLVLAIVLILFVYVLARYGRKNSKGFDPNDTGNRKLEIVWMIIPVIICVLLAVPTVQTLYALNHPPKATATPAKLAGKTLTIDVTSVQWKWLFRYPDQKIETVNYAVIPAGTPVKFRLHAYDAMNAFWVPELGGQQYTMTDMPMKLWLQADKPGNYDGRSSNYSGRGFAHMTFTIMARNATDFDNWVNDVKQNKPALSLNGYKKLLQPDTVKPQAFSSYPKLAEKDLNKAQMQALEAGKSTKNDSMQGMKMDKNMDMDHNGKGGHHDD
ncbi:cytochrome aa3 quinol oxidase subunit II [Sporolactobacillus kofuensis]|uniref:Quinol oxidase polypeptide II n=1 Tax=Sporolactobacillus kofuensis TaxID=269672 RepID=A0ABW1WD84_9BACL|nr:cytochrome aa3 quinol oxidase subunit II [Sporolactobacillus kofuensis]MCO7175105.1 cytochrome aa3 quinol oxidase subunit II [Sporolactobacillus kofuensis]